MNTHTNRDKTKHPSSESQAYLIKKVCETQTHILPGCQWLEETCITIQNKTGKQPCPFSHSFMNVSLHSRLLVLSRFQRTVNVYCFKEVLFFFIFYLDSNGSLFSFTLHWKSGVFSVYSLIFLQYIYILSIFQL